MKSNTAARKLWPTETRSKELSPRVKLATRLYGTGLVKTKAEAARLAGLNPGTFYIVSTTVPQVGHLMEQIDKELEDETIDTSRLIKRLGREALGQIAKVMRNPMNKSETILKAAQDLADRSPETSKVVNINAKVETPLSDEQVAALRTAVLEAATLRDKFPSAAQGSYVTVTDQSTARSLDLVKERAPLALPPGGEGVG
jgi:hypothetical protein